MKYYAKKKPADVLDTFHNGVYKREGESTESLIKRWKKEVQNDGILMELKKREYYVAPSLKKRLKHQAAVRLINKANKKRNDAANMY